MKVWLNGRLVADEEATLSVLDHGTLYGDGVFEGIRVYGGRVFRCKEHVDRLYESARRIRLAIPYPPAELVDAMDEGIRANGATEAYIRLVVTRGPGNLGLNPFKCPRPSVFIIVDSIELYPQELYETGMAVIIARTVRPPVRMLDPSVKSLNYLNNIRAKIEAIDAGVPEAILLNEHGNVAEGTGDNIFIVRSGRILTPPAEAGILIGITRGVVFDLAEKLRIPTAEADFRPQDVYAADECFLSGTAAEVIPVTRADDRAIGTGAPGPVTKRLFRAFREYVASGEW